MSDSPSMIGLIVVSIPPNKIDRQITKAGLPRGGAVPFHPVFEKNQSGALILKKERVTHGPKKGKKGYVDLNGRIWVKDRSHGGLLDHWDVQEEGGRSYFRVDPQGNRLR